MIQRNKILKDLWALSYLYPVYFPIFRVWLCGVLEFWRSIETNSIIFRNMKYGVSNCTFFELPIKKNYILNWKRVFKKTTSLAVPWPSSESTQKLQLAKLIYCLFSLGRSVLKMSFEKWGDPKRPFWWHQKQRTFVRRAAFWYVVHQYGCALHF